MTTKIIGKIYPTGRIKFSGGIVGGGGNEPPEANPDAAKLEWITSSGVLSVQLEGDETNLIVEAAGGDGNISSFAIVAGELPPGLTLNQTTGRITGTVGDVTEDMEYPFTIEVTDRVGNKIRRAFAIQVANTSTRIMWRTPATLGNVVVGSEFNTQLEAVSL